MSEDRQRKPKETVTENLTYSIAPPPSPFFLKGNSTFSMALSLHKEGLCQTIIIIGQANFTMQ